MARVRAGGREQGAWGAGALVYSGRPDPCWPLDAATAGRVAAAAAELPALARAPRPSRRRLGYRGALVEAPDGTRWTAHAGVVVEARAPSGGATPVVRRDEGRAFERLVLATAPPGVLPSGLLDDAPRAPRRSAPRGGRR